jgi:hypothetical protein
MEGWVVTGEERRASKREELERRCARSGLLWDG